MKSKVNEIQISYKEQLKTSVVITSSKTANEVIYEHWDKNTIAVYESFKVVLLNNANKVKGIYQLSTGGMTGTLVDIRLLFAIALKTLATGLILCHNHPSSRLKPSEMDKQITEKIIKASKLLDIKVLDHLIITPDGDFFSFADNGLI